MNSHKAEFENEINSNEMEHDHQRDTFLHVKDEKFENSSCNRNLTNGLFDESGKLFRNFSSIQTSISDEDNNSNFSAFINSQTKIKI